MDPRVAFFFYLAALVCLVLAATGGRVGGRSGGIGLVPLGLALWLVPLLWNTATQAF